MASASSARRALSVAAPSVSLTSLTSLSFLTSLTSLSLLSGPWPNPPPPKPLLEKRCDAVKPLLSINHSAA